MLENIWFIAAVWMGLALLASLISIRTGISVALIEILVGVVAGNLAVGLEGGTLHVGIAGAGTSAGHLHHVLQSTEWTNFLALLGSGVLTFLAGAEIDPISLKLNLAGKRADRRSFICHSIRGSVALCRIRFGLAFAPGSNCWYRAVYDFRRRRLRGDDRRWI